MPKANNEEEYLEAYIGNNYKKVKKEYFSIPSLILGPINLLYRKIYVPGILLLAIISIAYYCNSNIGFLLNMIVNLFLSFKFNKMYYESANRRIDEIIISNPDKTKEELLDMCRQKGKPFIVLVVFILLFIIVLISILPYLIKQEDNEEKEDLNNQVLELTYSIPKGSKKGIYDTNNYKTYHYNKNDIDCFFIIEAKEGSNLENYAKTFYEENSKKEEQTIHNNKWLIIKNNDRNHYIIKYNNNLYHVSFQTQDNDTCKRIEKELTSTLLLK